MASTIIKPKGVVDAGVCKMKVWSFKSYGKSCITKMSINATNIHKQYWPIPCYVQPIHVHEGVNDEWRTVRTVLSAI